MATENVEAIDFGLVGDGVTENTSAFARLFAVGGRRIHLQAGDYVTHKVTIPANTVLLLDPGVVIRDAGRLDKNERLVNIFESNVQIIGTGARVVANRATYTSGEQRHGIFIYGAHNVSIEGLESRDHGGDGFYIGGPPGSPATDVVLKNCVSINNRRQGLSITSARRVQVIDSQFVDTQGTNPQFGIDLEPDVTMDVLDQIKFVRPITRRNTGGGILIVLTHLDGNSEPVRIDITGHRTREENPAFVRKGDRPGDVISYNGN